MTTTWKERTRPVRLEGRYEFDSYEELRTFLDAAADLSEKEDLYPDLAFGSTYVNVTIHTDETSDALSEKQHEFARQLDVLRQS